MAEHHQKSDAKSGHYNLALNVIEGKYWVFIVKGV